MQKSISLWSEKFISFLCLKNIKKTTILLTVIILIGSFLRLYNFEELLRFNNDQVRDIQIVEQIKNGATIFLGPKAGGTKFNLGPAFYYLEYLSGLIFGFSPAGISLFIPLLSIFSIYLFYLLFKKIFSPQLSLALTFLYSISFYAIKYSHFAWNPNAIPFFLLAFLLLIIKIINRKSKYYDFILLGIIIGIGIQLHTTLLVLMPLATIATLIIYYIKNKEIEIKNIILLFFIILLFNIPLIYGDFINNGKNIQEFLAGSENKTSSSSSIFKNIASTTQFFLQGATYHLIGIEPQKNWLNILKLFKSKNINEILMFLSSLLIFLSGIFILIKNNFKQKLNTPKNIALATISIFTTLSFILFIFIGNELNIRFFIILPFLPYLLLGIIAEKINLKITALPTKTFLLSLFISIIFASNLSIYLKTYNLSNYTAPASAYGGISYGELKNICLNIKNLSQERNLKKVYLIKDFEYKNSLKYICHKQNIDLEFISKTESSQYSAFFDITEKDNSPQKDNLIKEKISIQRFKLFLLEN